MTLTLRLSSTRSLRGESLQSDLNNLFVVASLVAVPVPGHLFAESQPSRSGECTKLLSRLVSVVDSFVKVKGELEVDGTGDFEVGEIQNLSEVVDVEASHSSSYLDDDVAMAAMLMPEMLMELLCFRRQKFDYDDAWRRTFLPTRPLKSAFSMRAASYEPRGDDFAFT